MGIRLSRQEEQAERMRGAQPSDRWNVPVLVPNLTQSLDTALLKSHVACALGREEIFSRPSTEDLGEREGRRRSGLRWELGGSGEECQARRDRYYLALILLEL